MSKIAPLVSPISLTAEEREFFTRQFLVPGFGIEAQGRLKAAKVAVIGCGGLGSPVCLYLAGAGVGTIGLIDGDRVSPSNLHRQIIHTYHDVDKPKTTSARESIEARSPFTKVIEYSEMLSADNAQDILSQFDLIIDASDNIPTRYLASDVGEVLDKPVVYGSVLRAEGQVSVFWARHGATYRDIFPVVPSQSSIPTCREVGVLGSVCAQVGSAMTTEAIKVITGFGQPLIGKIMFIDADSGESHIVSVPKRANRETNNEFEYLMNVDKSKVEEADIPEISAIELKALMDMGEDFVLLDVREDYERDISYIESSVHIPLGDLSKRLDELPKDKQIICQCKGGARSLKAAQILLNAGFEDVSHLNGGIISWIHHIEPKMKSY